MTTVAKSPPGGPPVTPLHRNRDFMLLWSGSAVSIVGSTASTVAYPLLVLALTGSASAAGVAGFFTLLPTLLFQLPAGALVDRWNRRRLMIWCDALRCLGAASIVAAVMLGELRLAHILIVGFAEGTLSVFYGLAAHAAVPNVVEAGQLRLALSRNEARGRAATMLGTPLGGILFGIGRSIPFLLDAVSYLVALVSLLFIRKDFQAARPRERVGGMAAQVWEGLVWLKDQPFVRAATLLVAGSNLLFRALFLIVIVMATDAGASSAGIGIMIGAAGAGGVLGSLTATWFGRRLPLATLVIGANWVWAVLMGVIVFADDLVVLALAYAAMWFVGPIWNVAVGSYQLSITPDRLQGRVLAATSMLSAGALPIGALVGGLLLDAVGPQQAAGALAVWMVLLAGAATLSRSVRRSTTSSADS
ncbi:MFS transporter [Streptomyces sp. NPDC058405]|uniref:MFS transporter n=1 Tax=Streptomyces sp. NPDC058405 TaxID=3346482 RepID=UPI00366207EE